VAATATARSWWRSGMRAACSRARSFSTSDDRLTHP
jgi:hypothetical protein